MSYHASLGALGAGPGPTRTYRVDLPLPWGKDTPIEVPLEAIVRDALTESKPTVDEWRDLASAKLAAAVKDAVEKPLVAALDKGTVLVEKVSWGSVAGALLLGVGIGWLGAAWWKGKRRGKTR